MRDARERTAKDASLKKEGRLEVRMNRNVKTICERAAQIQGRSLTDFVVNSVLEAANRTIHENKFITLGQGDKAAFADGLLNAPAPNSKLRKAAQRHSKLFAV